MMRLGRAEWWSSESGHDGGWRLRLVAVANCGAADRSIGSDSARAAAPASLAGACPSACHAKSASSTIALWSPVRV